MRINYITYQYFPDNRANTFQTFSTIKAFLKKNIEINLIFPNRKKNDFKKEDYFKFYELKESYSINLNIQPIDHKSYFAKKQNRYFLSKVVYLAQHYLWSVKTINELGLLGEKKNEIFFTRSYIIFYLLRKSTNNVIFECHQLTKLSKILIKRTIKYKKNKILIITLSPFINNVIKSLGISHNSLIQLDNGYEESYFSGLEKNKIRKENNISQTEKIFIFGGGLTIMGESKNLESFIDIFNEYIIANKVSDFTLLIYCLNLEDYHFLKNYKYNQPLNEKIFINSFINEKAFVKQMVSADVGIIPLPNSFYVNNFSSSLKFAQYVRANLLILGSNVEANLRMRYENLLLFENTKEMLFEKFDYLRTYNFDSINNDKYTNLSTDKRIEKILEKLNLL